MAHKSTQPEKSASAKRREEAQAKDTENMSEDSEHKAEGVEGDTVVDENKPFADALEAKEALKSQYAFGEKRQDGEIEGVTVNVDQYEGPRFEAIHQEYVDNQIAAAQKGAIGEEVNKEPEEEENTDSKEESK